MSALDNLDRNESMDNSEEFALELLRDAADSARALLGNLPNASVDALCKYPVVAATYALLVHLDHSAEEQYSQGRAIIEELRAIRESINFRAARRSGDDPTIEPQPPLKQTLSDYAWLRELLEIAQPRFSDVVYHEALTRLRRLAGV